MTDDIIRKATTADYIETIDNLRAEVERLRSDIFHRKEHLFVNAFPDGGYAMRILQSYRDLCDEYVSDNITGGPTNPLCIAINEANEKRKLELDKAISNLGSIAAKDARIKELEALNELNHKNMRSWLDTTTDKEFLDKLSSEIGFKDAYIKRLEAAFLEATKEIVYAIHEGRDAPEGEDVYAEKVAREALEQLRAEDKIGGGDGE